MAENLSPEQEAAAIREAASSPGMLMNDAMQSNIDTRLAALDEAAKAEWRPQIEKLKNRLALARRHAAQAEQVYGEKYKDLLPLLEGVRAAWESENALELAEYERTKTAAADAEKDLREALCDHYRQTGEKRFDEHLSVRVMVRLDYELEKATEWAKANAPFVLVAEKKAFEKIAKDRELDFVTKIATPAAMIATSLPVVEDAQIDQTGELSKFVQDAASEYREQGLEPKVSIKSNEFGALAMVVGEPRTDEQGAGKE